MQGLDREVAENFGLEVHSMSSYKDAYILNTSRGRKILKRLAFSPERLLFVHGAKEHLIRNNFSNIDRYACTLKGDPFFTYDNGNFTVTDFIEGHECNFDNDNDVKMAARVLSEMHKASAGYIPPPGSKIQDDLGKLPVYFKKRLDDIRKLKKQAKKGKGKFDHLFVEYVDYFYNMGENAWNGIIHSNYDKLVNTTRNTGSFCHRDYTHHNIIVFDERMTVTNFDYCCFEIKVYDLANLIRRKMRKCSWDINKAKMIIDAYTSVETLNNDDMAVMKLILQFPQKFWRVVNRYYNSRRSWSERSYMYKLLDVIGEVECHKRFMDDYEKLI